MMKQRVLHLIALFALMLAVLPFVSKGAHAQTTLPTAPQVATQIKVGWNLGNALESTPGGETAWGNPVVTQQFIDTVKAAGFNSIRIPVAWDGHATNSTIDAAWLARVKEVVDYAINDGMYVIINGHWDGGWLEEHPLYTYQTSVNAKQQAYWTQIANYFKNYDEHLLFAGTNEVHANYSEPTAEHVAVQESYNQTFVTAVRATGGNNSTRTLVVQTYNTNMWYGLRYFTMPTDSATNRLMVEVHYYDPYDYTLNGSGPCLAWGAAYTQYSACSWAQEAYVDDLFNQVRTRWVNAGIPVILGEYGVATRSGLNLSSREFWIKYITAAAVNNGMKPYYWDNGVAPSQSNGMGLFNRSTGTVVDQGALNAVIQGAVPCTLCTGTPTRTPTKTATITMTPCYSCGFKLQYKAGDTSASPNQITPQFKIFNNSTSAVPMSEFSIRYWYTNEGGQAQSSSCDYAAVGCANVTTSFTKMVYPKTGADTFMEVGFTAAAGTVAAGANSAEIQLRFNKPDFTNYTQTGDYSFDATKTAFADWDRITLYRNGGLVWGVEPGMGPTNTPGATNTPGPTNTITRTPTLSATPAITLTFTPTRMLTPIVSPTRTNTPTRTPTGSNTPVVTPTRTSTITNTPMVSPTITRTLTRTLTSLPWTPTRTPTQPVGASPSPTATTSTGGCSPVTSTITAPFTFDGAGTFCWQSTNLGAYMNSWNTTSVSINGVNITNLYMASGSYPAKIGGYWYVSYNSAVAWGHFEAK